MAINYSYPEIGALATGDLLTIVDISNENRTNTLEIGNLSSYIITTSSLTNGSGTAAAIPKWSDADTLTDSVMSETVSGISLTGDLTASNDLIAGRDITVTRTANIGDLATTGAAVFGGNITGNNDITALNSMSVGQDLSVGNDLSVVNDVSISNSLVVTGSTETNALTINAALEDGSGTVGTSGQVLSSTGIATQWIDVEAQAFSSLTTTGTSGAATLVAGVLNVPQYASSAPAYTSLFVKLTQSGNNTPTYSILSNDTSISFTGVGYSTGYTTLFMASGTYPADGEAMVITGGYKSARTSNPSMTGFHDGQTIKIITGYYEFDGTTEATFVKDDFGFGGVQSTIVEIRVFN